MILRIEEHENGKFQFYHLQESEANKIRLKVAVNIIQKMSANYPEGSAERWAVEIIRQLLEST